MFSYLAYGLRIQSALELPELLEADFGQHPPNVTVRRAPVEREFVEVDERGRALWTSDREACYFYERSGKFLAREGREIVVDPAPGAPEMLVRLSLIGPALGLILMQRGYFVLHASSVAVAGHGVAFLGHHAAGKSTLAASFHARGHRLLADDLTALRMGETETSMILPSFPHLKLWPDSVESLGETTGQLPKLHPDLDKRRLEVKDGFDSTPASLDLLCVLRDGPAVALRHVEPELALTELLGHWYGARFGPGLVENMDLPAHFMLCAQLARNVPLVELQRPFSKDPAEVGIVEAIEEAVRLELAAETPSSGT